MKPFTHRFRLALSGFAFVVALSCSTQRIAAATPRVDLSRFNKITSAIDANGVHHRGTEYQGTAPWLEENVGPKLYPYEARHLHQQGLVIVHVVLDPATGKAKSVTLSKSSGFPILDTAALKSISQWKWPPGKWKEIELPMEFSMGKAPGSEVPRAGHKVSS